MFYGTPYRNSFENNINNNYKPESYHSNPKRSKTFEKRVGNFMTTPFCSNNYNVGIKPKGLRNIGATCYMNATLQCFFHVKKLTKYFVDKIYVADDIKVPDNSITSEYIKLVKELYHKDGQQDYAPYEFKDILGKKNPLFQGIAANDSKDLILFLEEELAKELALKNTKKIFSSNNGFVDQTNEMETFKETVVEFQKGTSIIKDIFYFLIKTVSICKNCNSKLFNFQIMNFLIFPLQKTYEDSNNMANTMMLNNLINNMNNNMNNMNNFYNNNNYGLVNYNYMNNNINMNFNQMNNNFNSMSNNNIIFNPFNNNSSTKKSSSADDIWNNNINMNYNQINYHNRSVPTYNMNNINRINTFSSMINNSNDNMSMNYNNNMPYRKMNSNIDNMNKNNFHFNIKEKNEEPPLNSYRRKAKVKKNNLANNMQNIFFGNNNNFNPNSNQRNNMFYNRKMENPYRLLNGSGGGGPFDTILYGNKKNKGPKITLDQCFTSFLKPDYLTGENKQYCNRCKTLSDALYSTSIYSTPNILILILNYGKGVLFECDVQFDEYINIANYIETKNNVPTRYRLLGAIVHIGPSSMGGHFISYCRSLDDKDKWYKLNDSIISEATFSEIKQVGIPYVLFYENVNKY